MFPDTGHRTPYGSDQWTIISIFNAVVLSLLSPQWTLQVIYASLCSWLTGQDEEGRLDASSAHKDHILLAEKRKPYQSHDKLFKCVAAARPVSTWHFDKNCSFSGHQLGKGEHFLQVFLFCHCFCRLLAQMDCRVANHSQFRAGSQFFNTSIDCLKKKIQSCGIFIFTV